MQPQTQEPLPQEGDAQKKKEDIEPGATTTATGGMMAGTLPPGFGAAAGEAAGDTSGESKSGKSGESGDKNAGEGGGSGCDPGFRMDDDQGKCISICGHGTEYRDGVCSLVCAPGTAMDPMDDSGECVPACELLPEGCGGSDDGSSGADSGESGSGADGDSSGQADGGADKEIVDHCHADAKGACLLLTNMTTCIKKDHFWHVDANLCFESHEASTAFIYCAPDDDGICQGALTTSNLCTNNGYHWEDFGSAHEVCFSAAATAAAYRASEKYLTKHPLEPSDGSLSTTHGNGDKSIGHSDGTDTDYACTRGYITKITQRIHPSIIGRWAGIVEFVGHCSNGDVLRYSHDSAQSQSVFDCAGSRVQKLEISNYGDDGDEAPHRLRAICHDGSSAENKGDVDSFTECSPSSYLVGFTIRDAGSYINRIKLICALAP